MALSLSESLQIGVTDIMMRKVRSLITVFGIILGVMCIMVVLAIINGMNKSTLSWMQERGGTNKVEVQRNWNYDFRQGGEATLTLAQINQIRGQLPEAEAIGPIVSAWNSTLQYKGFSYSDQVIGVLPDHQKMENWYPDKGRFFNEFELRENANVIVLGSSVARDLFKSDDPLGESVMLKDQMLTVIGVMQEKYWENPGGGAFGGNALEYMNRQSFVPLSTMMNKIDAGSLIRSIQILAKSPEDALSIQKKLRPILLRIKNGRAVFRVSSAQETMQQMEQNSKIFSMIFIMIGLISLLVGGIVIMNIMLASIKERTREIGVRLAVGARRMDIFVQFMVQTVLITGLGGVFGIILGYAILDLVSGYLGMPMLAGVQMILVSLLVSVGVGLIFGIAPAVKASKLDPVIALRDE
ncbi:MAG: ABC transporter permease [Candidatus Cloacimonadaceae bacterium]|jgi:putative ABC transport system permease protein|nr:ABC transporter permease [Candidatus Cloacimonadota bacterium]MCK9178510.1 ABC transporter permease [Candidatus Cloacimonadota bacterium]MDD3103401.1 ABC transporter permease [Candidatus Cloacimonadota bacterium]MDY0128076.1 ABC transporter permease [Candidatus Cloacimonadaceae bacterium]